VTDALLIAPHVDSALFVVQQNKVDRALAKRGLAALRKVTPNVLGAVLNAVDLKTKGYYGYAEYRSREASRDARGKPEQAPSGPAVGHGRLS
jgi:Mrp family chromosome partitioning ATPase